MKSKAILPKVLLLTVLIVLSTAFLFKFTTDAGSLTAVYIYLSRIQTNLNGTSDTVEMVLAFAPSQAIDSGGTVTIEFPDAEDTGWCRAAGDLAVLAVGSSITDLSSTNWEIDAALTTSGTLTASCSQGSTGTVDTILIENVGALSAGTTYGVKISNGTTGKIGTHSSAGAHELTVTAQNGTTIDSKTFKISLVSDDSVQITAEVTAVASVTCTIDSTSVNLGTLYPGGAFTTGSHTITTGTSGTAYGYFWAAYGTGDGATDAGLWKNTSTTHLLESGPDPTIDLTISGSEGFGITLSQPDGAVVPASFSNASPGVFGTIDHGVSGAKLVLYQNGAQGSNESSTVTYGARAGASAPSGTYNETVYLVCGGYF